MRFSHGAHTVCPHYKVQIEYEDEEIDDGRRYRLFHAGEIGQQICLLHEWITEL